MIRQECLIIGWSGHANVIDNMYTIRAVAVGVSHCRHHAGRNRHSSRAVSTRPPRITHSRARLIPAPGGWVAASHPGTRPAVPLVWSGGGRRPLSRCHGRFGRSGQRLAGRVGSLTASRLCVWVARPIDVQIGMAIVYLVCVIILVRITWLSGPASRSLWRDATDPKSWAYDLNDPNKMNTAKSRSLTSYLLLPRPHELFARFWIIPLAWLVAAGSQWGSGDVSLVRLLEAVVVMACFEMLIYQARYIVNDIRSIDTDSSFSSYKQKSRFPTRSSTGNSCQLLQARPQCTNNQPWFKHVSTCHWPKGSWRFGKNTRRTR